MDEEPAVDVRNRVDGWAERVAPEDLGSLNGAHHVARYRFAAGFAAGRRVADLCCGTGYGTSLLLSEGARDAVGIDLSPDAIAEAERKFPGPRFLVADASEPLDLDADLRVCFEGIEHVADPDGLVRNLRIGLPDDGLALVSTPNGAGGHSGNPHHLREYTPEEFRELLSGHFSTVGMYFQFWFHDPFDPLWGLPARAKGLLPGWLRRRPQPATGAERGNSIGASRFRPIPEAELSARAPRLRYGKPAILIAVCHQ